MSSSSAEYTEEQKADRSAVTSGLLEQKTAQTLQDAGDSSLRKRAENKAALAAAKADQAAEAAEAAKAMEEKKCTCESIFKVEILLLMISLRSYRSLVRLTRRFQHLRTTG